jgi:hypothetical protein
MHNYLSICGIATAAIAFSGFAPIAVAQENAFTLTCQEVGVGPPEPLADREGHSISVGQYSCRADSGPLGGGVLTGANTWEWDKGSAVLLTGNGVTRKPGSTGVYQITEGKLALTMADGKVTGVTSSGRGAYLLATGGFASVAGKPFSYTTKTTGPGQFVVEGKME